MQREVRFRLALGCVFGLLLLLVHQPSIVRAALNRVACWWY